MQRLIYLRFFFFQAEDGIRALYVTGVQTCALPIYARFDAVLLPGEAAPPLAQPVADGVGRGLPQVGPTRADGTMPPRGGRPRREEKEEAGGGRRRGRGDPPARPGFVDGKQEGQEAQRG